jgi:hypothetical protein
MLENPDVSSAADRREEMKRVVNDPDRCAIFP